MEYLGLIGKGISPNDATNVKCSLLALSKQVKCKLSLWGCITGFNGSYFIAAADVADVLDQKRPLFYSVDGGVNWAPLSEVTEEQAEFCDQIRGPFMGNPKFEYKIQKELPMEAPVAPELPVVDEIPEATEEETPEDNAGEEEGEKQAEDGEAPVEEVKKPKRPKFRILAMAETARVAHFVRSHDVACRLVPRGSLLRKDDGVATKNRSFSGLTEADDVSALTNYCKLVIPRRENQSAADINQTIYGPKYHAAWDFLEPISEDMPQGVWSVKFDATFAVVTVENLLFPGSFFYHKVNSAAFGQFYMGDGRRNLDLCFVLP